MINRLDKLVSIALDNTDDVTEKIVRVRGGFKIRTKKGDLIGLAGGRPFPTRQDAEQRERQINFFKSR